MDNAENLVNSDRFKSLVRKRWTVSIVLTVLLFVLYYGYILIVAYDKGFMAQKIGEFTTNGIVMGVSVIIGAWVLGLIYIYWANNIYDKEVEALKNELIHIKVK